MCSNHEPLEDKAADCTCDCHEDPSGFYHCWTGLCCGLCQWCEEWHTRGHWCGENPRPKPTFEFGKITLPKFKRRFPPLEA